MISLFPGFECVIFAIVGVVAILGFMFWLWMLVDCATNEADEGNNKVIWILIIVLLQFLGALVYCCFRRPTRIRELGK